MIKELIKNENRVIRIEDEEDSYKNIDKLSSLVNVNQETLMNWHSWYNIDGIWYYFKPSMQIRFLFNELMGEQLAKYFGIDTVHYELAYRNKVYNPHIKASDGYYYGIISKNFREKDKEYLSSIDLNMPEDKDNIDSLKSRRLKKIFSTKTNYEIIINKLLKMIILDFYMEQTDRRSCNFCFSKDKSGFIDLCPLYDYESSFEDLDFVYRNALLWFNVESKRTLKYVHNSEIMQGQLYKLMDIDINSIIKYIKEYYELIMPEDIEKGYLDHDKKIKEKVMKYKMIR